MRRDIQIRRGDHAPPASTQPREDRLPHILPAEPPLRGMFDFRYSCTELYTRDGRIHVHMQQSEYRDGRLRTEECEGAIDRDAAQGMVADAQQQFLSTAFGFARLLLAPLLGSTRRR